MGGSGGGYITMGTCRHLAEANERIVKFQGLFAPFVGNSYCRGEPDTFFHPHELQARSMMNNFSKCLAKGAELDPLDVNVFPGLISDQVCRKMPPTFIMTFEFDSCRKSAEEAAVLFRKNKRLIGFGCIKGTHHMSCL